MSIKGLLKQFAVLTMLIILAAATVSAASEVEVTDGSIGLCDDSEVLVDEPFSGSQMPTTGASGVWKTANGTPVIENGVMSLADRAYSYYLFNSGAITYNEAGANQYILKFDFTRTSENIGMMYPYRMYYDGGLVKDLASKISGNTYSLEVCFNTTNGQSKVLASGIKLGEWCSVEILYTLGKESITCDITVYDDYGGVLGTITDYASNTAKNSSSTGIAGLGFCCDYEGMSVKFDDIQFYAYKKAETDPTITESPISGIPEMAEGTKKLIDENFDGFAESITEASYIGKDGSSWRFEGMLKAAETKILSSGRKVLKLSDDAGLLAAVSASSVPVYNDEAESNKYVQLFGMKYVPGTAYNDSALLKIKGTGGAEYEIFNITPEGVLTNGNDSITLEEKWYSVAVTYELKEKSTAVKAVLTDGETVKSFKRIVLEETSSIDEIIYTLSDGGVLYIDNLSLYQAVNVPAQKPEARNMVVTGICYNGRTLTGAYEYYDINQDEQGADEYYWVRSDASEGGEYVKIPGTEQQLSYTLQSDDVGKYVFFAVIPKKADGYDEQIGDVTYKMADSIIKEEPAYADLELLIASKLGADDLSDVTEDLLLVLTGENGSRIEWSSDDTSVIGIDGTVTRKSADKRVILTATVTSPDGGASKEHKFEVTVTAKKTASAGGGSGSSRGGSVITMPVEVYAEDTNYPAERPLHRYDDVADNHWATEYIQELYYREIAQGTAENNFEPERNITREEFTKMVVSAFGLEDSTATVEFIDVDSTAWYYPYVAAAYKSLIVSGIGNGKFGIGEFITRQDIAVIAHRIITVKELQPADNGETNAFSDWDEISDYAKKAVTAMQQAGIMCGSGDNEFRPKDFATRAEVAKIIVCLLEYTDK